MLILCQKLHICTYDRQNFSRDLRRPLHPPKVEMLELPLSRTLVACQNTSHYLTSRSLKLQLLKAGLPQYQEAHQQMPR